MRDPVEQRRRHFFVAKYIHPFAKIKVAGDDRTSPLMTAGKELK